MALTTPFAGWKKIEILSREGQNVHLYQVFFDDDPTLVVIEQFVPEIMRRRSIPSMKLLLQVSENHSVKIWIMSTLERDWEPKTWVSGFGSAIETCI